MPDIITLLAKRWKLILGLTLVATILAMAVSLLRPKEYLATVTALPANSSAADKARIFNTNIESLYPELGSPDELDRIEGTTKLDTLYLAVADSFDLITHYKLDKNSSNAMIKAAWSLKKNTDIRRSAYGELKIKVWDVDAELAAKLANALLAKLNQLHQHIQSENNRLVLEKLRAAVEQKTQKLDSLENQIVSFETRQTQPTIDSGYFRPHRVRQKIPVDVTSLPRQIKRYQELIAEYELSVNINPQVLIPVEYARPSFSPDKPRTMQITLFAFGAAFIFSFLLALFAESRHTKA